MGNISSLESRQEEILKKLADLKLNMKNLRDELNSTTDKAAPRTNSQGAHVAVCAKNNACQPCSEVSRCNLFGTFLRRSILIDFFLILFAVRRIA